MAFQQSKFRDTFYIVTSDGKVYGRKGELAQQTTLDGYKEVRMWYNKRQHIHRVHRLVMEVFEGESDLTVDHLNGDKTDNRLENLQYVTQNENQRRRSETGIPGIHKCPHGWRYSVGGKTLKTSTDVQKVIEFKEQYENSLHRYRSR